jgi:hypothetical protein
MLYLRFRKKEKRILSFGHADVDGSLHSAGQLRQPIVSFTFEGTNEQLRLTTQVKMHLQPLESSATNSSWRSSGRDKELLNSR